MTTPIKAMILLAISVILISSGYAVLLTGQSSQNNKEKENKESIDTQAPIITSVTGDLMGDAGTMVTITTTFSDNIAVTSAKMYYRPSTAIAWSSKSVLSGSVTLSLPSNSNESWYYYIVVNDAAWPIQERLIAAARAAAPDHTLIATGARWSSLDMLLELPPLDDENILYEFHFYEPFPFTHQGATWSGDDVKPLRNVPYPSSPEAVAPLLATLDDKPNSRRLLERYGNERWNKEKLAARFMEGIEWGARHGVPLYCGEFGVFPPHAKPEHRANWFRDFGQVLAEHKIGWAVWGWDEGFGLSRRYVDGKPVVDQVVAKAPGLKSS